ncbi:hypothetical protein ACVNHC_23195 [Pannonibacter sp. Q-1]|uniref:Uncharacterized protein n=1 Tax=Pannonibacter phragmitetus TaxID=121719 RepID=A0A0U3FTH2_9HYPH|nr:MULTISPECIES: hypothetical protein [Pannonibacter]ALV29566.1 hypothetical protein APZ00_23050 [Pannonibacter phragmitetus]
MIRRTLINRIRLAGSLALQGLSVPFQLVDLNIKILHVLQITALLAKTENPPETGGPQVGPGYAKL